MATEINVPVKLQIQNLQSLVGELEKKLGNLKVGSSGFKNIQSLINSIRGEIDKLQVQTSKPFMDASQFTKAEHSVERLEDQIEKVGISISRIKFSDLELTSGQKADLKAFEDQINSIKEKLRVVKSTAKDEFLNSAMGQEWLKIDDTAFSKSLSQITNNIRRAVQDQKTELEKLEEVAKSYQKALSENERIKDFTNKMVDDPANGSDLFSKKWQELTKNLSNGKVQFQAGGKNLMVQWLESQLKIDSGVLHSLLSKSVTASNIGQELKKLLNEQLAKNEKVIQSNPNVEANVEALKAKYEGLLNILRQVGVSEQQVAQVEAVLRQELGETSQKTQEYQDNLVNAARANTDVASTSNAMKSQLESLRETLQQTNTQFIQMQRTQQSFNQMKMAVVNFMGFNQVLNLTKNAIRNAINHIQELDSVMNKISIVTDMSTADLWNQVDAYSQMAQAYGVSIKGAYEVSQIYYQQGLQTNDVLTLTNETLKLARISGLDYAQTTDYMTTALRGFKMEMSEASTVVDVYSNLASHTAVSQEELAVAMSKTASSMEGVGATFEEASAMIATMVAVTRESATNIGSAMKSIASRYGELTKDPMKLIDDEGEVMAFNKVDAALQSVGISMKTADGQFREFTDVIIELGEKWNELESTQQRYIATQFAGNRQQSRFLALVSNVDLLKSNLDYAENSEDTGTLQALKALDSIEAKIEQVKVAYQQFYTTVGIEDVWKGLLDSTKNVINTLNGLPKLFGKIPVNAVALIYDIITLIKGVLIHGLTSLAAEVVSRVRDITQEASSETNQAQQIGTNFIDRIIEGIRSRYSALVAAAQQGVKDAKDAARAEIQQKIDANEAQSASITGEMTRLSTLQNDPEALSQSGMTAEECRAKFEQLRIEKEQLDIVTQRLRASIQEETGAENLNTDAKDRNALKTKEGYNAALRYAAQNHQISNATNAFASGLNMVATMIGTTTRETQLASGSMMAFGGILRGVGSIFEWVKAGSTGAFPWMAVIMGAISLINGLSTAFETTEERIERLTKKAEELNNQAKEAKANYRTLDNSIKKLDELKEKRYESAEAAEEYQTAVDELAEKFPAMIAGFDEAGNIILDTTSAEQILADARKKTLEATYEAAKGELAASEQKRASAYNTYKGTLNGLYQNSSNIAKETTTNADASRFSFLQDLLNTEFLSTFDYNNLETEDQEFVKIARNQINEMSSADFSQEKYEKFIQRFNLKEILQSNLQWIESQIENLDDIEEKNKLQSQQQHIQSILDQFDNFNLNLSEELIAPVDDQIAQFKERINEKLKILNSPDFNINSEESNNLIQELNELFIEAEDYFNQDTSGFLEEAAKTFAQLKNEIGLYIDEDAIYQGNKKLVISAWLQEAGSWSFLSESASGIALMTKEISSQVGDKDWSSMTEEDKTNWKNLADQFETFWKSLSDERKSLFNSMMEHPELYTGEDILKEFSNIPQQLINSYFTESAEEVRDRLQQSLSKSMGNKLDKQTGRYPEIDKNTNFKNQFYKDFYDLTVQDLTSTEESILNNILNQYNNLSKNGYTQKATDFGEAALRLFEQVNALDSDISASIWKLIRENGLTTLEGIQNIRNNINNNETTAGKINDDILQTLYNNIIPNINLEIQTMTSNLLETWEDTSKELSSAMSGGVSLKEADELIQKASSLGVDISLDNFTLVGDKLILATDYYNQYYQALRADSDAQVKSIQSAINAAKGIGADLRDGAIRQGEFLNSDKYKADLEAIGFNWKETSYWRADGTLSIDGIKALEEAIENNEKGLANYNRAAQIAADQLMNAQDRSQGIYKLHTNGVELLFNELKNIAQGLDLDGKKLSKDAISERAIKESINSVYNTLVSDVLSKGFKNINLDNYEGLIQSDKNTLQRYINEGDYTKFVERYAQMAGSSIDEINELLLQAQEKSREQFSEDLIKDFTFTDKDTFRASYDSLVKLANAYDKGIEELINAGQITFDETTQQYIMSVSQIGKFGIDLSKIDYFNETVQESIDSLFSGLTSDVQKALEGKIDAKGVTQLRETLSALNLGDIQLDFVRTSDGFQLMTDSIFDLYTRIRKVDQLSAKKLLPNIKNISKSYDDLASTLKEYKEALEANKESEAQLLSDLLQDYLSNPESYQFDKSYATTQDEIAKNAYTGAFNTYKNWAQANRQGYIAADQFTSTLAQLAKYRPDQIIGTTGKTAQQLYDERFGYMTTDRSGNPIYDLKSMGLTGDNITALMDAFEEYTNYVVEKSNIQQRAYMDLVYAQRELNKEGTLPKEGKLDLEQIKKLAKEGSTLATVFKNITFGDNDTLYTRIFGENGAENVDLANQFISILSNTNLSLEEMQEQVSAMLGDEFVVSLGEDGKFKIDLANPVITVGGQELTGSAAKEWQNAISKAYAKDINTEAGTITYTIEGQTITLQVQGDGSVEYSITLSGGEYAGAVITASTEAELRSNLAAFGYLSNETAPLENVKESTITISGITYTITYDAEGKVIVKTPEGEEDAVTEATRVELQNKLNAHKEKENIPLDVPVEGEISALDLSLAEGAAVELSVEQVTLTKPIGRADGEVQNVKLTYTGNLNDINVNTSGNIIQGTIDSKYIQSDGSVTAIDLTYLGVGIVPLNTDGKIITGKLDSNNVTGKGTVPAGKCELTINGTEVTIIDSEGNKYTGIIPSSVGNNTTLEEGILASSKASFKIAGGQVTISTETASYTAIIPPEILATIAPTGEVSADNCDVFINNDTITIKTPEGKTYALTFAEGALSNPSKTIAADDCDIDLDSNTITIKKGEGENALSYTVEFEDGILTGEGTLPSGKCNITVSNDGSWIITNEKDVSVTIPGDKLSGSGTLSSNNCFINLDSNTLSINGTDAEGNNKTFIVEFNSNLLEAYPELKSGNCQVKFDNDGNLTISQYNGTDEEGKYTVTIDSTKIKGSGSLTTADIVSQLTSTSYTIVEGEIPVFELGTTSGVIVVDDVEVQLPQDPYDSIKRYFYNEKNKLSRDNKEFLLNNFGIEIEEHYGSENDIFSASEESQFMQMINALYEKAINKKQLLNAAEQQIINNLLNLNSSKEWAEEIETKLLALQDSYTYEVDNLSTGISSIDDLNSISTDKLTEIVSLIEHLSSALSTLYSIEWAPIIEGLNNLTSVAPNEETDNTLISKVKLTPETEEFVEKVQALLDEKRITKIDVDLGKDLLTNAIDKIIKTIESTRQIKLKVVTEETSSGAGGNALNNRRVSADKFFVKTADSQGNVALAGGRRQTLMGELGPELYVQNGHYYIAGAQGPEMVSLEDDAIVFNHIQTRRLMAKGSTYGHGKPVTNEYEAAGMARASGGPDWNKFSSWSDANAAIATALEHISRSASDSNWQEQNKKAAEQWKRDYVKYLADQQEAANKQLQAAELQEANSEELQETANDLKATRKADPNRLHTGYKRVSNTTDTVTSADQGRYRFRTVGPSDTSLGGYDSARIRAMAQGYGGSGSTEAAKKMSELQKAVATTISNLLTQGFESIDLSSSDYEKLDAKMKAEMQEYIKRADASYREFVEMYGEAANLTVSEFNTQYFEAWQKDLGNTGEAQEIRDAAKNLNFFAGGSIGGSAEDWVTLFGDYTAVVDLVDAKIIDWNEDLQQYVVTSIEALQQFDTNLDITEFQDIIADSLRATSKAMTDLISKAESGEITYSEFNELNAYLDQNKLGQISRDALTQTANGLVVNYKTLANLYAEAVNKNLDKETLNTLRNIKDTRLTNINNALQSGMGGSMKWEELDNLQSLLDDYDDKTAIKFTQTTEGLKLSTDTLIHFYNLLQKVDGIQAHLNFKRLNETLKENNTHYRSATTILARIKDLQDAINNSERYNDEKIRQYQEELSLAEEILAVRATSEDDSFDFINQKLPGGMNNPLTYMNAVAEGWREFRDATKEDGSGIIDYQKFYNMANEANNVAKITGQAFDFLGYTLDGGIENLSELMTKASLSLHFSEDGSKFGVSLAEFGNSLVDGADSFSVSTDQMVHAMAESQIKVLDSLIAMFEMIVAMESFEGADLDMDGLLDLDEIFDLSGLTEDMYNTATNFTEEFRKGAQQFVAVMESDKQFEELAESIKLNGYSLAELVRDAADDGVKNLAISVEMFQQGLSVLYEALKNGDYNPQDIYNSLKEFLLTNESGYTDTFQLNDMIIDLKYGAEVKVTDEGYKAAGQTFDNQNDAIQAAILAKQGVKDIQVVEGEASGTLAVGKLNMTVTSIDKNVTYNGQYSTLDDAIKAQYEAAKANGETTLKLEEWKIKQEITVVPVVNANLKESALELDQDQINAAIGKSYEDIKAEWEAAQGSEESTLEFEATYGIQLNENTTEEDWARFKELAGIETKNVELNVAINVVNSDDVLGKLLGANGGNVGVGAKTEDAEKSTEKLQSDINSMGAMITVDIDDQATSVIDSINKALDELDKREVKPTVKLDNQTGLDTATSTDNTEAGAASAAGTVSGAAMASGTQTLMGELGPELYVSNGRYHLAGQNGAEFVNLPDDAIVFNHLQTQKLLATGSAGRGKPITNERNAVAMAHGTEGPAAASAKEILAQLKQMRAMWQSLANISVKEMAGVGGSEGGGETAKNTSWLAQVERWYDLLQKIARLEKEINYQEALRNKLESDRIPNGKEYFDTQVQSLDNLKQQALAHKELAESQEDYFNQRRKELNERKSPFAKFYTFDEGGQLKYQPGAFDKLSDIVAQDEWGKPKYTPQQQYDLMKSYGFESYMKYDNSGNPIDQSQEGWQLQAVQAVWERMEAEQKEMQTLYDSKEEQKVKYLDSINDANKLLQQMVDNQIDLEKQVVSAIEEREQAVIDALSDERQALADSTNAYIKGLQDSLDKERKMREKNDSDLELSKLQSRLSMLQRGGGSAAEIANLQREISDKQTDMYFDAQSQQIEAIQDASDLQLEKLQTQIDLMSESLAYAKENGLLWAEATEIMKQNPEFIAQFITDNSPDFASQSVAAQTEELRKILFSAEQFASYYDYIESLKEGKTPLNNTLFDLNTAINDGFEIVVANDENKEKQAYEEQKKQREEEAQRWEVEQEQRKADEKAQQNAAAVAHENEMYDLYGAALGMSRTKWDEQRAKGRLTDESLQEKYNIDGITQKIQELQMDMYQEMQRNKDNPQYSYWSNQQMAETQDQIEALEALRDKLRFEAYAKEQGYTKRYAHGGLVNYTGLAMVHGSDARPEAFLNADEVKVWKEDILGSSSHSLTSQMLEMQSLYEKFNSTISSTYHNNSEGINIERVDVNMNVAQLANDYDARRAGREVMNEILNIANKSSSGNRVGR